MSGGGRHIRRRLLAGLVVIAPATVTALVLWWIFQWLDGLLGRFLYPAIGRPIPGLGLLVLVALLLFVGWAAERAIGARLFALWDQFLERLPLARRVYNASNRIVRTLFGGGDRGPFGQVVLVEYPSDGRWAMGFLTGDAPPIVAERVGAVVAVFVPTTPNPTSGWIVLVDRARVRPLAMTVDEALTYILSAGAVGPSMRPRPIPQPADPQ